MKKIILIILAVLAITAAVLAFTVKVNVVDVSGNAKYTAQEIEDKIFNDRWSRYSVVCFTRNILGKKNEIPFVEDYKITFVSPTHVEIIVYEKSIVGYVTYMSSYMYFDKDGIVVESSNNIIEGYPEITGLKFGSIVLYKKLPVENEKVFDEILNITQDLTIYTIKVKRIHYSQNHEVTLYLADEDIDVVLGSSDNIDGKIDELNDILPELSGHRGTLYLDTYSDSSANTMYTFKSR